jgi:hypothetical protein
MIDVSHVSSAVRLHARREMAMLPRVLRPGEEVVDICYGASDDGAGLLVATDRRLVMIHRRLVWGAHVESIPLARVTRVEHQQGVRLATLVIEASGHTFEWRDVDRALAQTFCARVQARLTSADPDRNS